MSHPPLPQADNSSFSGTFRDATLREGLQLHYSDGHDGVTRVVETELTRRLNLILFLDGQCDVRYGSRHIHAGPHLDRHGRKRHEALLVSLAEPEGFARHMCKGAHMRKVIISIGPEWLENDGLQATEEYTRVLDFNRRHLALERWTPSPRSLILAEQIIHPPECPTLLEGLYQESRVVEIVGEALSVLTRQSPDDMARGLRPHERRRILQVLELLDSGAADGWSLERIAREVNIHANTLQRQFQAVQGTSLFNYLRRRKLDQAREALECRGISIDQAASLAGYGSAANFATAFKRQFGLTPRQVRARL